MKVKDIILAIEEFAPPPLQESWDNAGLIVGDELAEIESAVITLDVNEKVIDDAIEKGDQLIIAHHPLIFAGLKKINGKTDVERALIKAIKNNIAIYAAHTNLDVVKHGVSWKIAQKMGLKSIQTLIPQKGILQKIVTFVPVKHVDAVREALLFAGAGHIGDYDFCSFNVKGEGSFRAGENTNAYVGEKGSIHFETEIRLETIFPKYLQRKVINALLNAHPYEEVAFDIYPLENTHQNVGLGVVGILPEEEKSFDFLLRLKKDFNCKIIRHTPIHKDKVSKVAIVGGAGSSFLSNAIAAEADVFVTGDFKYHQFFEAENKIIIADIGHYESEQFTKELFYEIVTNKFSKFATRLSEVETNPVNYLF